jgi:hypothetical protein
MHHKLQPLAKRLKHFQHIVLKNALLSSFVIALGLIVCVEAVLLNANSGSQWSGDLVAYAEKVVADCANAQYRPTCYEETIPKVMDKVSMEEAFQVTRLVQDMDRSYQYCHVLGHKLSAREAAKDPSLWREVIQRCPSGVCSNGCIHGAFQERFRKESLTKEELNLYKSQFAEVCEKRQGFSPTGLEQASCYHALGHLFMYVTDAEINDSIALCKELTIKGDRDYSQLCFDGSFMQIFQPLEPDDFELIKGKEVNRSQVKAFCDNYTGREQGSCWSEAWPLFRTDFSDPKALVKHCSYLPSQGEKHRCFNAITYVITAQMNFDLSKIGAYCKAMPAANAGNCFAQAASRLIETDYRNGVQAVSLCTEGAPYDKDDLCFKELLKYSTYNFHVGGEEFKAFCATMPEPWKATCLQGNGGRGIPPSKAVAE